jgi:septal ring factor EnvC (AmiA/AmiB activator)
MTRRVLLTIAALAAGSPVLAQDRDDAGRRLDSLKAELKEKRTRIDKLGKSEGDVLGKLQELEETIDLNETVVGRLKTREKRVTGEITLADSQLSVRESLLVLEQADYGRRLVAMSKNQVRRPPDWLFFLAEPGKAAMMQPLLATVSRADRELIAHYDSLRTTVEKNKEVLVERRGELHGLRNEKERETKLLASSKDKRNSQLRQIRSEKNQLAQAVQELTEAAQRLESLLKELIESGAATYGGDGRHVKKAKGRLPWPVKGKLVEGFGYRILGPKQAKVPHNGLSIKAPEGTDVRAVADGAVTYTGRLRGYGEIVILDHGGGYFSLYGHLLEASCFKGQIVLQGDLVGAVGDTGSLTGPELYFELRENRVQVDPIPWLKP